MKRILLLFLFLPFITKAQYQLSWFGATTPPGSSAVPSVTFRMIGASNDSTRRLVAYVNGFYGDLMTVSNYQRYFYKTPYIGTASAGNNPVIARNTSGSLVELLNFKYFQPSNSMQSFIDFYLYGQNTFIGSRLIMPNLQIKAPNDTISNITWGNNGSIVYRDTSKYTLYREAGKLAAANQWSNNNTFFGNVTVASGGYLQTNGTTIGRMEGSRFRNIVQPVNGIDVAGASNTEIHIGVISQNYKFNQDSISRASDGARVVFLNDLSSYVKTNQGIYIANPTGYGLQVRNTAGQIETQVATDRFDITSLADGSYTAYKKDGIRFGGTGGNYIDLNYPTPSGHSSLMLPDETGYLATRSYVSERETLYKDTTISIGGANNITIPVLNSKILLMVSRSGIVYYPTASTSPDGQHYYADGTGNIKFNAPILSGEIISAQYKYSAGIPVSISGAQFVFVATYADMVTAATGAQNKLFFVKNDEVNGGTNTDGSNASSIYQYTYNGTTGTLLFYIRQATN